MLARTRLALLGLASLTALSGCGSGGVSAGDVLVVAQVEITPPDVELVAGRTQQMQATPKTSSGISVPNRQVTWSSDDLGIASVSTSGMVTAVAPGDTRINATVDGVKGTTLVTITPRVVATVSVVPDQVTLLVGESNDLQAIARDSDGQAIPGQTASFASDNPFIATVSPDGHVTAVAPGLTVVRATIAEKIGTANVAVNSLPATQLDFQSEPATGAAGQPLPPVRIAVQNNQGGTVTEGSLPVTIDLVGNPTGAVLSGTRTMNAVNGVATFSDLVVDQAGIGYTLRASSGTLQPAESAPFAVVASTPTMLSITTQPSAIASTGAPLARQPVIQLRDAAGNAVAKSGVQVTTALEGAGGTLGGTRTMTTNAEGVATFTNLVITGASGTYTLLFAAPGLTAVASDGITLAGTPSRLGLTQQPSATAEVGVVLERQPIVQIQDADGNAVAQAGVAVTASVAGGSLGGNAVVVTDAAGRAAFTNLSIGGAAGVRTIMFSAPGLTSIVSDNVVVGAGSAAALGFATSPPASTTSGAVLSPAPVLRVVDAFGNPVAPATEFAITVAIASGAGGSLSGTTSVTTSGGSATFSNLILTGPTGAYSLRFSGGGFAPAVSGNIVIGAGAPTGLVIITQPSSTAESGTAFAVQPVIEVRDALGNPVPQSGIVVTASIAGGGGTLSGAISRSTDANGRASFTDLIITGAPGPRTLRFAAAGLGSATSSSIAITAPPPSTLRITTQPSGATESGVALAQQPVIEVTDKFNQPVGNVTITAEINSGPAGASLAGVTAQSGANGLAAFSGLAITGDPGDYTIRFVTGNLSVVSGTVKIRTKPVKLLLATRPSQSAASGAAIPTQPVVQIADKDGQPVPESGATVTAVIASGPAGSSLSGASAVSDASGAAAFSGLAISGPIGTYTLRFSSGTLTTVTSGNITLGPGAPATITMVIQPPTQAQNDEQLSTRPDVRVQDGAGNLVPNVVVTASIASGAGTLKGTLVRTTGANGRVEFSNLSLVGLAGSYTLAFTAQGGVTVGSRAINLVAGSAKILSIQEQPPSSVKSGADFHVKVDLRDTGGNLVTTNSIVITATLEKIGGNLDSFGGDHSVATINGVASFNKLSISIKSDSGTFQILFHRSGMTDAVSGVITVTR